MRQEISSVLLAGGILLFGVGAWGTVANFMITMAHENGAASRQARADSVAWVTEGAPGGGHVDIVSWPAIGGGLANQLPYAAAFVEQPVPPASTNQAVMVLGG